MGDPQHLEPGLWAVLATPFSRDSSDIDTLSFAAQIEYYAAAGARGVVAFGVNGEADRLTRDERERLLHVLGATCGAEVPFVIGVSSTSTFAAIDEVRHALAALETAPRGVMAKVISPISTFSAQHFRSLHEATGVPIVAQDYPRVSGVHISVANLIEVVNRSTGIIGVKAESPPTALAVRRLVGEADVAVFGGLGAVGLADELAVGARGAMTGFAYPQGLIRTVESFLAGDPRGGLNEWSRWLPYANFVAQDGIGLAMRKETLRRLGVIEHASVRPPGLDFPDELGPVLEAHMAELALLEPR